MRWVLPISGIEPPTSRSKGECLTTEIFSTYFLQLNINKITLLSSTKLPNYGWVNIVVIFSKFTFVEFLVRQKIACHERIHLKFTNNTQLWYYFPLYFLYFVTIGKIFSSLFLFFFRSRIESILCHMSF